MSDIEIGGDLDGRTVNALGVVMASQALAVILNGLVIVATAINKELHTAQAILLVNLALTDFVQSATVLVTCAVVVAQNQWTDRDCVSQGFVIVLTTCFSQVILLIIALDRYWIVCKHKRPTTTQRTLALLFGFVYALISAMMPFYGNAGRYQLQPSGVCCVGNWPDPDGLGWAIWCVVTCVGVIIIVAYCYYAIFVTHKEARSAVAENLDKNVADERERRLAARMLLVVVCYVAMWASYDVLFLYEIITRQYAPFGWDTFATVSALSNAVVNPMLYSWTDPRYRRAFKGLLPACLLPPDSRGEDTRRRGGPSHRRHPSSSDAHRNSRKHSKQLEQATVPANAAVPNAAHSGVHRESPTGTPRGVDLDTPRRMSITGGSSTDPNSGVSPFVAITVTVDRSEATPSPATHSDVQLQLQMPSTVLVSSESAQVPRTPGGGGGVHVLSSLPEEGSPENDAASSAVAAAIRRRSPLRFERELDSTVPVAADTAGQDASDSHPHAQIDTPG